jgi:hypothetical protein
LEDFSSGAPHSGRQSRQGGGGGGEAKGRKKSKKRGSADQGRKLREEGTSLQYKREEFSTQYI